MKPLAFSLLGCCLLSNIPDKVYGQENSAVWTKSIGIQYATPETNPPALSIDYPTNGQRVADAVIQAQLTATDDTRVESLRFTLNGVQGDWNWAPAMPYPWGDSLQLVPGVNTLGVECADYWGNLTSDSVTFEYLPGTGLALDIGNGGQIKPNYQGAALNMETTYSMTAHPGKGFKFDGWSGSISTNRPKLTFVMQPSLSLAAHFKDIKRPLNVITFKRARNNASGTVPFAVGKAADNSAVTNVYYQLNGSGWGTAITTNGWKNWETDGLTPVSGRNVLESYAVDDSGLNSRTNRLRFRF
jgi:hypothetical protein